MTFFFLTSDTSVAPSVYQSFINGGQKRDEYFLANDDRLAVGNFRKQRVNESQSYILDKKNWLVISGTILYKDLLGSAALPSIFNDFVRGKSVDSIREASIGSYVIAISVDSDIYIFSDPWASRQVYYSAPDSNYSSLNVSTSLRAIELCSKRLNRQPSHIASFSLAYMGVLGLTPFKDIHRLLGDEYLFVSSTTASLELRRTSYAYFNSSLDTSSFVNSDGDGLTDEYFNHARSIFRSIALQAPHGVLASGGRDSRTVIAGLLSAGVSPEYVLSVMSSSELADANPIDATVAGLIAQAVGSPQYILNHSCIHPYSHEQLQFYFDKWGYEYGGAYNSNIGMDQEHMHGINPYPRLIMGGFSAFFLHARVGQSPDRTYSISDLWRIFGVMKNNFFDHEGREITQLLNDFIERILGFQTQSMSKLQYIKALYLLNVDLAPGTNIVAINRYGYYLAPFHTPNLASSFIHLSPSMTANDKLQLSLINELYPSLLDVPFFSSHKWWKLDRKNLALVPIKDLKTLIRESALYSGASRLKSMCRKVVPSLALSSANDKPVLSKKTQINQSSRIRESIVMLLADKNCQDIFQHYNKTFFSSGYLPQAYRITMMLYAFASGNLT